MKNWYCSLTRTRERKEKTMNLLCIDNRKMIHFLETVLWRTERNISVIVLWFLIAELRVIARIRAVQVFVSLVIGLVVLLHVYKTFTIFSPPSDHDLRARLQGNLLNVVNPVQKLIPIGANTYSIWNGFAETSVVVLSTCLRAAGNWATKIKQHH